MEDGGERVSVRMVQCEEGLAGCAALKMGVGRS